MKYLSLIAAIFTGDFFLKNHMEKTLEQGKTKEILKGRILLRKYHNEGACLNIGEKKAGMVAAVSAGVVDDGPMLDLCYEEDSSAQVDLNCVMTGEGELVELQGTGEGRPFTIAEQQALVDLCAKGIREVQAIQKAVLGG